MRGSSWWTAVGGRAPEAPAPGRPPGRSFRQYGALVERELMPKYGAVEHWAKIEVGPTGGWVGAPCGAGGAVGGSAQESLPTLHPCAPPRLTPLSLAAPAGALRPI